MRKEDLRTTSSSSSSPTKVAMKQTYQNLLKKHPIKTKSITSAFMSMLGELLGQILRQQPRKDMKRVAAFGVYGGVIVGPLMHWWYGFLERLIPATSSHNILKKIIYDRLLLTPPFLLFSLFSLRILCGLKLKDTLKEVKTIYLTALLMNWKVWTLAQFINFKYMPPSTRVLFGNLVAVWWNCYLSLTS